MQLQANHGVDEKKEAFWGQRNRNALFAFLMGFGMTLLVHGFAFMNHVNSDDQIRNSYTLTGTFNLGRWFLDPMLEIGTRLAMPWLNGLIFAVMMGLAVALVVDMLQMKKPALIWLVAWAMTASPTVVELLTFIYCAEAYGVAIALATAGVWICNRWKWGWAPSVLFLVLSLGIYQAFWPFAVSLFCILGLRMLLQGDSKNREVLLCAVKYGLVLASSMAGYLVINKIALSVKQVELGTYLGINQMGNVSVFLIPHLMKTAYVGFFHALFENASLDGGLFGVLCQAFMLLFVAASILLFALKKKRPVFQSLCLAGITAMIPLIFNTVYLMNAESVRPLMMFSLVGIYVLVGWLAEQWLSSPLGKEKTRKLAAVAAACLLGFSSFHSTVYANQLYYLSNLDFNAMSEYMSRVVYRLESHEKYTRETPVLFVGKVASSDYGNVPFRKLMKRFEDVKPFRLLQSDSHIRGFLFTYLEITTPMPDAQTAEELAKSQFVKEMPAYPDLNCIQLVEDVLVVKVGK